MIKLKAKALSFNNSSIIFVYNHCWDHPNSRIKDYSHIIIKDIIIIKENSCNSHKPQIKISIKGKILKPGISTTIAIHTDY